MTTSLTLDPATLSRRSLEEIEPVDQAPPMLSTWFPFHRAPIGQPSSSSIIANPSGLPPESPDERLARMLASITPENRHEEIDFGPRRGLEEW